MTTTAHRRARSAPGPRQAPPAGERVLDAGVRATVRNVVGELVDSAAAEAREAAHQLRCIHRLWLLAWEDREIDWVSTAELMTYEQDERVSARLETEDQMVLDLADEVGPALNLSALAALERVREALVLAEHLPGALEALEAGRFSARHASVLADQWRELVENAEPGNEAPTDVVLRLVDELQERAPHCTVAQLRTWAHRRRDALRAETQQRRHRAARARRCVWVENGEDGMACLHAMLPAPVVLAAKDRLDALVDRLPAEGTADPGDPGAPVLHRTRAQLRADVFADLLLAGEVLDDPHFPRDVRGEITVTVPVLTLLAPSSGPAAGTVPGTPGMQGVAEAPASPGMPGSPGLHVDTAVLMGHGPIDAETARELTAGAASWHRVLTHPGTGVVLDHDRTVYAVPADLKRRLRLRDGTCRFPGCRRRAARCDLDHTVAWADGGRTAADNLAHLCRHHHLVKHRDGPLGRWSVRQLGPSPGGGVLEWTSPAGRTYRTVPDALAGIAPDLPAPPEFSTAQNLAPPPDIPPAPDLAPPVPPLAHAADPPPF